MKRSRIVDCPAGLHRPDKTAQPDADGIQRGNCRGCGSALMRTAATRMWFLSSLIG